MFNNYLPINHLRESNSIYVPIKHLYNCGESSTNRPRFLQNKANLFKAQMNVTPFKTKDYANKFACKLCENKPNSNPIKTNLPSAQINVTCFITKDYENEQRRRLSENKPNQTHFKLETHLALRARRSLRLSFSESSNRGPNKACPERSRMGQFQTCPCKNWVIKRFIALSLLCVLVGFSGVGTCK